MLTASVYRCARHQSVHRVFVLLFQCVCVLTLFSTACYIVDIRSRYLTPRRDFHALNIFAKSLWNASGLPATVVPAPSLHAAAIQAYDEPVLLQLNASLTRTGAAAATIEGYGLERTECLWSALLDPAARPSPAPSNLSLHLHVFFLHGNSGSHTQGEYWSCAVRFASSLLGLQISTYAFQWAEQANVHRGRLVGLQADYVADVVEAVVRGAPDRSVVHQAWLVGHSMGGVVARLAAQLLDTSVELGGIVTFNAPHRFPPLLLDAAMADVYRSLTASERVTPAGAAGEEAAERPAQLSSAKLVEVCRAATADCLRYRRRQSRAAQLISISSGEMDLQIEPATAFVSQRPSYYVVSVLNTLSHDLCTRTTSHDGVLVEPCTVMLGALRLLAASVNQMTSSAVPADGQRRARDAEAEALAQLPLPPGIVSRVSLLGQLLWQWHLWPWAVAALYGYVLFAGLWPGMVHAAEHFALRGPARRASSWLVVSAIRWVVSSDYTVAVFLVIFYGCTTAYAAVTGLYLVCSGETEWFSTTSPWQWESYPQLRHLTATYAAPLQLTTLTLLFLVLSVGPVTVGINAGMAMLVIGDAVRHVKGRIGRWRRVFGTARRRRVAAALFPGVVATVYVALLLLEIGLTARAMVWLVLFLVVPSFRHAQASRSERVATPVATATDAVEVVVPAEPSSARAAAEVEEWPVRHLPGMLYAAVYLIQLHPFFTLRNVVVSHTFDEVSTVDARNFVAEVGLLVLLCCAAATPPLSMRDSRVWRYAGALSSAAAALAVAWMMVHPVETFLVLPALLWCLPSFLFSTLCA